MRAVIFRDRNPKIYTTQVTVQVAVQVTAHAVCVRAYARMPTLLCVTSWGGVQ